MKKLVFVAYLLTGTLLYASDSSILANGKLLSHAEWRELGNYRHMAEDIIVLRDGTKMKATIIHIPAASYSFGKVPFDVPELAAVALAFKGDTGKIQYITTDGQNYVARAPFEDFIVDVRGSKERIPAHDVQLVVLKQRKLRSSKSKPHLYALELANGDQLPVVLDTQEISLSDGWKEFQLDPKNIVDLAFNGCAQGLIKCHDPLTGDEYTEELDMAFVQDKYLSVGIPKNAASIKLPWDSIVRLQANVDGFSSQRQEESRYAQQQAPRKSKLSRASARVQQDHWITADDDYDDYDRRPQPSYQNKRKGRPVHRDLDELDLDYASAWDSDSYYRPSTPIPKPKMKTQPSRLESLLNDDEDYLAVEDFEYSGDNEDATDEDYQEESNFRISSKTYGNHRKSKIAAQQSRSPRQFDEIAELEPPAAQPKQIKKAQAIQPAAPQKAHRHDYLDDFGVAFGDLPRSELLDGPSLDDLDDEDREDHTPPNYMSKPKSKHDSHYYLKEEHPRTHSMTSNPIAMEVPIRVAPKQQPTQNSIATSQSIQTIHVFPELMPLSSGSKASDYLQAALLPSVHTPTMLLKLDGFAIEPKHVTNREYLKFVQATNYTRPTHWRNGSIPQGEENQPVVNVTFKDAQAYAAWAGKRLPTHSEWERASANSRLFRQSGQELDEWTSTAFVAQLAPAEQTWEKNHPNHTQGPIFRVVHNANSLHPLNENDYNNHTGFRVASDIH